MVLSIAPLPEIPLPFKGGLSPPCAEAERGRGLYLVELCPDSWGACPLQQGGKLLWVECVREEDCQWG